MLREEKARLEWVQLYQKTGSAGLVCKRCGISRPTLRKWVRRFESEGLEGLSSRSRRPKHSPAAKITPEIESWILALRLKRKLGARRIQNELQRLHECSLSLATIHKILKRHDVKPLRRKRRSNSPWQK
ncbi:MAG: helix-turn-helix domain containing protein [Phycisphaerae bacterium]|nr:helix-turn-helix domain containing protein [Phycisphaerae bacterium]